MNATADNASVDNDAINSATTERRAIRFVLVGRVQGIGLRPTLARLASEYNLVGSVSNTSQGVELVVQGKSSELKQFGVALRATLSTEARITSVGGAALCNFPLAAFTIREASDSPGEGEGLSALVPADVAVCDDCLSEIVSSGDRRFGYPFTSCTACGPRYSIIERMPYERRDTAMRPFAMCPVCEKEYATLNDRRFHAQTNACPQCGPQVWIVDRDGRRVASEQEAVRRAIGAIRDGRIVAIKGLGGYQLLVDACNKTAVARLRGNKGRPQKPLAVMVDSLESAIRLADLNALEQETFASPAGPIVVARARPANGLAANVYPGIACVGLMRPTTPLHAMLAKECGPIIATSGNMEGEPLAHDERTAADELRSLADLYLHHDRKIERPIDDSVVRVIADWPVTLRAARGIGPLPLAIPNDWLEKADCESAGVHSILAVGGHQKTAIALWNGFQAVLAPHLGDLDTLAARDRFVDQTNAFCDIYRTQPDLIVHDLHPDYFTTRWAHESGRPTLGVQHHHAHIVAAMIEPGLLREKVLGVAWDGTGYGPDGTIWGGEFLLATCGDYQRVATLQSFSLPGGESAIREPQRIAIALVAAALGPEAAASLTFSDGRPIEHASQIVDCLRRPHLWPVTTSVGRLFDGVAAIVLPGDLINDRRASYEGHWAMLLEAICDEAEPGCYPLPLVSGELPRLDWRPLIGAILADRAAGVSPGKIAMRFHRTLAGGIRDVLAMLDKFPAVLCGGVFQNRLLLELTLELTASRSARIFSPHRIPPNDGGLAAGQLAIGLATLSQSRTADNGKAIATIGERK